MKMHGIIIFQNNLITINQVNALKAWEKLYESEDLDEAIGLAEKVIIKSNDGVQIIAQVEDYRVETFMEFQSPSYTSCNCPSRYPCRHEAALTYHIKNHLDDYIVNPDFDEIFDLASHDDLNNFLKEEFETNPDLKDNFLRRFSDNGIDKDYYNDKLDDVLRRGEGHGFEHHGFHDLDLMGDELYDFIFTDISMVLSAGEHDFACDLLIRIAMLLNDEVISTHDSWHDLTDRFME